MTTVHWLAAPDDHDFPAAADYLSLLAGADEIGALVAQWRRAEIEMHKAKDVLRAARLDLLPAEDEHVASDLRKIHHHTPLSPVLLVRGDLARGVPLQIADGYHRVCASYLTEENTDIPCLLATPTSTA